MAVVFRAADGPLQFAEALRRLFQQGLDIGRNRLVAFDQAPPPELIRVWPESQSSSSLKKRAWAWPARRSR